MTTPDELEQLLSEWAAHHQLSPEQSAAIRGDVLRSAADPQLDPDWLWRFLRPLTTLLDQTDADSTIPYLKLA
jgi:hypothetical protein